MISKEMNNEKLRVRVRNAGQILAIVRLTSPRDEEACELFLRFRNSTIHLFAFAMAEVFSVRVEAQIGV